MLKKWRKKAGLTQAELAEQLGVSQNTVSYWEIGKVKPDLLTAERLAAALNVPVADLIEHFKAVASEGQA